MSLNLIVMLVVVAALEAWYFFLRKQAVISASGNVLKDLVGALLAALCPILWSLIVKKTPSFGDVIDVGTFTGVVTWLIYAAFWGVGVTYNVVKAAFFSATIAANKLK